MSKYIRTYRNNIIIDKETAIKLREFKRLETELKPVLTEMKKELIDTMGSLNKDKVVSNGISATFTGAYIRTSIDTDLLKEKNIELYNECLKTTPVGASIKLTYGE